MSAEDHVALLAGDDPVSALAARRAEHPDERLDVTGAELHGASLAGADLRRIVASGADLEGADLRGANLRDADLRGARLASAQLDGARLDGALLADADLRGARAEGASFSTADVCRARFDRASLREARFDGARVDDARFDHALLTGADLADARGLVAHQLRGACVTTANLPDDVARFSSLAQVDAVARVVKVLAVATLLSSAYLLLTIGVTRARDVVSQGSEFTLPLIGADVPFAAFFTLAPSALFVTFVVLGLTLQSLWELVADLPAFFPDGTPLDKRAQPSLLGALIRLHVPLLSSHTWPFSRFAGRLGDVLVHRVVPLVFLVTWWTCLPRQSTGLGVYLLALTAAAFGASVIFAQLGVGTLSGELVLRARASRTRRRATVGRRAEAAGSFGDVGGHDDDAPIDLPVDAATPDAARGRAARAPIPGGSHAAGAAVLAAVVMVLPTVASLSTPDAHALERPDDVAGLDAVLMDVRSAVVPELVAADLAGSDLRGRAFPGAQLDRASLRGARVDGGDFRHASLRGVDAVGLEARGADMTSADLTGIDLTGADLRDVDFAHARLERARLAGARLSGALLDGVDLTDVDLSDTLGLTGTQLVAAEGWRAARLPRSLALMLGVADHEPVVVQRRDEPTTAPPPAPPVEQSPAAEPEPAGDLDGYTGDSVGTMRLGDGTVLQVFGPGAKGG